MEIRILGCSGTEYLDFRPTGFLINNETLMDAGSVTSALSVEELLHIRNVLISHPHMDHIKGLLFLAAIVAEHNAHHLNIIATKGTIVAIQEYLFNNAVWPDFSKIPGNDRPAIRYTRINTNELLHLGSLRIRAIPVHHVGEAVGFIVQEGAKNIVYTGDTGPTEAIWQEANKIPDLCAVFAEASYPNRMQRMADITQHLTPRTLEIELRKLKRRETQIFLFHLKPQYLQELEAQIRALKNFPITILKQGDLLVF